jgi:hypothetical protein
MFPVHFFDQIISDQCLAGAGGSRHEYGKALVDVLDRFLLKRVQDKAPVIPLCALNNQLDPPYDPDCKQ